MAQQTINIGVVANDGSGDFLRDAFDKANDNFTELYTASTTPVTPDIIAVAATRALVLTDANDIIEVDTSGAAVDITIPPNATVAFPVGTLITIALIDATNAATLTAGAGVTLNGVVTGSGTITATAYSGVTMYKRAIDEWVAFGAIGAVA